MYESYIFPRMNGWEVVLGLGEARCHCLRSSGIGLLHLQVLLLIVNIRRASVFPMRHVDAFALVFAVVLCG